MGGQSEQPGSGAPYWYEWFVGLNEVISLLLPETHVESVTFQEKLAAPVDDVVVRFNNGQPPICYQVKYTSTGESSSNLTFVNLISKPKASTGQEKPSLLSSLAKGWREFADKNGIEPIVVLYSNRHYGQSSLSRTYKGSKYKALPLEGFMDKLHGSLDNAEIAEQVTFKGDMQLQWDELLSSIDSLDGESVLRFLRCLKIELDKPDLDEAEQRMLTQLQQDICGNNMSIAKTVFNRLCAELRIWTRDTEQNTVDRPIVERCVASLNRNPLETPINVTVPSPAFPSRRRLAKEYAKMIAESRRPVIFIDGGAGVGKTRLASLLSANKELDPIRFYAFRPLDTDSMNYGPDEGITDARDLWSTLLNRVRELTDWNTDKLNLPVLNELCTADQLREEVLRLAQKLSTERGKPTVLLIDGIDHAARRGDNLSFLQTLPSPETLPSGVKMVLIGQPSTLYPKYPQWLATGNNLVLHLDLPNIDNEDIACLLRVDTNLDEQAILAVSAEVYALTSGNTLSVVYASKLLKDIADLDAALDTIRSSNLSPNIEDYYHAIWSKADEALVRNAKLERASSDYLACVLYLLNGIASPKVLHSALPDAFPSDTAAKVGLMTLYPLLEEAPDGLYHAVHNDFRLYISKQATKALCRPILSEVKKRLAEYSFATDEEWLKLCFAVKLLNSAGMHEECLRVFDTEHVMKSISFGVPWSWLLEQASDVYHIACDTNNLETVFKVTLALQTLGTVDEHRSYMQEDAPIAHIDQLMPFDLFIQPLNASNLYSYKMILDRICWLLTEGNKREEAAVLYDLWFGKHDPASFATTVICEKSSSAFFDEKTELETVLRRWGETCALFGYQFDVALRNHHAPSDSLESLLDSFRDGFVYGSLQSGQTIESIQRVIHDYGLTFDEAKHILMDGLTGVPWFVDEAFIGCCYAIARTENDAGWLSDVAMAVLLSRGRNLQLVEIDSFNLQISDRGYIDQDRATALTARCFIHGCASIAQNTEDLLQWLDPQLSWLDADDRDYPALIRIIRAAACLGYATSHKQRIAPGSHESVLLDSYLSIDMTGLHDFFLSDCFIQFVLFSGSRLELWEEAIDTLNLRYYLLSTRQPRRKKRMLDWLVRCSKSELVREYVNAQYGNASAIAPAGNLDAETLRILRPIIETVDQALASRVDTVIAANVSSFTDHKDEQLEDTRHLFSVASNRGDITQDDAWSLLTLDQQASGYIEGTVSEEVLKCVLEWANSFGIERIATIRHWDSSYRYDYGLLTTQYTKLLDMSSTADEMRACFAVAYGTNSYYDRYGREEIRNVAESILYKARSRGHGDSIDASIMPVIERLGKETALHTDYQIADNEIRRRHQAMQDEIRLLSDDELRAIAFIETSEKWEDDQKIELACRELEIRGSNLTEQYEELIQRRAARIAKWGWRHYSSTSDFIIGRIAANVGEGAFFALLSAKSSQLWSYGYGWAARDIAHVICQRVERCYPELAIKLYRAEIESKRLWITADGLLDYPSKPIEHSSDVPHTIESLCTDILVDSLMPQDPHRCENVMRGLSWGGTYVKAIRERLYEKCGLSPRRTRMLIHKLVHYWQSRGVVSDKEAASYWSKAAEHATGLDEAYIIRIGAG
jgi:hypothetical protein